MEIPSWIDPDLWEMWLEQREEDRRRKKKKLTERMVKMMLRRLERFHNEGYNADEILENCMEKGWEGIYVGDVQPVGAERVRKWNEQLGAQGRKLNIVR